MRNPALSERELARHRPEGGSPHGRAFVSARTRPVARHLRPARRDGLMPALASPLAPTSPRVAGRAERATSSRCRVRGVAPRARRRARARARRARPAIGRRRGPAARDARRRRCARAERDASRRRRSSGRRRGGARAAPAPGRASSDRGGVRRPAGRRETAVSERPAVGASKYRFATYLWALALLRNADRVIMSVAGVPPPHERLGRQTLGLRRVVSAIFLGALADKSGQERAGGHATWSIATALTPFAAAASLRRSSRAAPDGPGRGRRCRA